MTSSIVPLNLETVTVGFVGVGRMGANMARCLHEKGVKVVSVFDANREMASQVAGEVGASVPTTLAELTRQCDVIFTVVSDDRAMEAIYLEGSESLFHQAAGKIFINCATVSPDIHRTLKKQADAIGAHMLEAPMASSIPQAREGTLYLMCAGEREVYDVLEPLLGKISASRVYTGEAGTAATMKALVNMVMNINTAGLAEGLGLGEAAGLDLNMVRQVFSQTGANSRVLETDGPDMQDRDHDTYFSAAHAAKDSGIALDLAKGLDVDCPLAKATKDQYDRMVATGLGDLDKSGVSELTFRNRRPATINQ